MASAQTFFNDAQKIRIVKAIEEAELNTSGEIRVHLETVCKEDVLDRAAHVFAMLKMNQTKLRNGVLIYLAFESRQFAIIGDAGINAVVPDGFWNSTKDLMISYFKSGDFATGLEQGILEAGKQMKQHFAFQHDDVNELPDDISFGK